MLFASSVVKMLRHGPTHAKHGRNGNMITNILRGFVTPAEKIVSYLLLGLTVGMASSLR